MIKVKHYMKNKMKKNNCANIIMNIDIIKYIINIVKFNYDIIV